MNESNLLNVCRERLEYNPLNGLFYHKRDSGKREAGEIAGSLNFSTGYVHIGITVDGKSKVYQAHRLAHLMMTGSLPSDTIDHKNGIRCDNRWFNLRPATRSQNSVNKKGWGKQYLKGVGLNHKGFTSSLVVDGKPKHIGTFDTEQEAHEAYVEKAKEIHGLFFNAG